MSCFVDFGCSVLSAVGAHIARNSGAYGSVGIAVGLSGVKNIPEMVPKTLQEWWTWMRNTFQTALPISRAGGGPPPTPPVDPAK